MRVIENPKMRDREGASGPLSDVKSALSLGRSSKEAEAQEEVIAVLQRILDNSFTLLRDVTLEDADVVIPLVLVGPTGIQVINPSPSRGIFRAREQNWEKMDDRQQQLKPDSPNLIKRTQLMARAVERYLQTHFQEIPEVQPALLFTHPGTHVDTIRPAVRIVMADGMERYVASVVQSDILLDQSDVDQIVDFLAPEPDLEAESEASEELVDSFSFRDEHERGSSDGAGSDKPLPGEQLVDRLNEIMPFSTRQWLVLGAMVVVNIIILVAFVVLVLATS